MRKWFIFLWLSAGIAGADGVWSVHNAQARRAVQNQRVLGVDLARCSLCDLDRDRLALLIRDQGTFVLEVPMPDGSFKSFTVQRSGLMHPDLAAARLTTTRLDEWAAHGTPLLQRPAPPERAWRIAAARRATRG